MEVELELGKRHDEGLHARQCLNKISISSIKPGESRTYFGESVLQESDGNGDFSYADQSVRASDNPHNFNSAGTWVDSQAASCLSKGPPLYEESLCT